MTAGSNTSVSKNQSPTTKLSHNAPNPTQSPSALKGNRQSAVPSRSSRGKSKEDRSGSSPKSIIKADHFSPHTQENRR